MTVLHAGVQSILRWWRSWRRNGLQPTWHVHLDDGKIVGTPG